MPPSPSPVKYGIVNGCVPYVGPVLDASNSGNPVYLRTYVAEVSLCRQLRQSLQLFHKKCQLYDKVRGSRCASRCDGRCGE
jgi:hypothetical protein